jgi:hypothetical protein
MSATLCTYLTTEELAARIKYDPRTIRERLKDSVLLENRHRDQAPQASPPRQRLEAGFPPTKNPSCPGGFQ